MVRCAIALSRNDITLGSAGERTWHGAFRSHSCDVHIDFDSVVLFLDWNGHPVGRARGRADRVGPGEMVHIRAVLPAAAALMRVDRLRWRSDGHAAVTLGPDRPWPFGHVPDPR